MNQGCDLGAYHGKACFAYFHGKPAIMFLHFAWIGVCGWMGKRYVIKCIVPAS